MNAKRQPSPIRRRQPLVSAVIAVRNGERFLSSAIESVLNQSYPAAEILVVDGHSTDRTADIAHSFAGVRRVPQAGHGVSDAWNVGIEAARGELVAFLSHDDRWTPDKLQIQAGYLSAHPETEYTIARVKFELEPGYDVPAGFRRGLLLGDHVGEIMETLVVRRSLFDRIGRFDPTLHTAEDADWYARAHDARVTYAIIPRVLLIKRVHDENTSLNNPLNDQNLLTALKRSIDRKREEIGHGHA
jgi:glycosyltransferase involved in cell wall biosynthesis